MDKARTALLRHDRMVIVNDMRSTFFSWTDRLIAIIVLLIAVAAWRASIVDRPFVPAASLIAALGAIIGGAVTGLIQQRLEFHASEGVLARGALSSGSRRYYSAAFHALALGLLCTAVLVARPGLFAFGLIGYSAGAGGSHLARRLAKGRRTLLRPAFARTATACLQMPGSGVLAAVLVLLPLLFFPTLDRVPLLVLTGAVAAIVVLALTSLDHAVIRFMTLSGYPAWGIIAIRARGSLILLAITVPVCLLLSARLAAFVVGAAILAGLLLMAMRILAYRVHRKRKADMIVGSCLAVVCVAGFSAPVLIPIIVPAILWNLHRRSSPVTWMLT